MSQYEKNQRKFEELVTTCDERLRAGRINEVVNLIAGLNRSRIPRAFRQGLAKIARRCGSIEDGLEILFPVIREERPLELPATPGEICEYAVLLSRNGSIDEALSLLSAVNPLRAPEALLYQGFCHVSNWDYRRARNYFESYLLTDVDDYSKLVARVNLAACYVVVGLGPATETFITETLEIARQTGASRLAGNSLELRAQYHLSNGDLENASRDLDLAQEIFIGTQSYDQLLIEKWRSLVGATRQASAAPLMEFRALALEQHRWEFVRDADLMALKFEFQQRSLDHLYFGSPSASYRARILEQVGRSPSEKFVWGDERAQRLVLPTGAFGETSLNAGKKIHRMISILIKDFYSPRRLGPIFSELYPDETFDVHSSNLKLRQLMKRTRRWFEDNSLPLTIEYRDGGYRIEASGAIGIELHLESESRDSVEYRLKILEQRFAKAFTVGEAEKVLGLSKTSLHRLFEGLIAQGQLERTGVGKATRYRLVPRAHRLERAA